VSRRARLWARGHPGHAAAWALAVFTIVFCAPGVPAAAASGGPPGGPVTPSDSGLTLFRLDVSHYPQIGIVATVPGAPQRLTGRDFMIIEGRRAVRPWVRQLSPDDIELTLAPDAYLSAAGIRIEQAAAASFLVHLVNGAQTGVVSPQDPAGRRAVLTSDPTAAEARVAALTASPASAPAARLAAALAAFSPGASVRRTVVLILSERPRLPGAQAVRFRRQLAASGTVLYVLDATARGAPAYDALATGSGGLAIRLRTPRGWAAAFTRIAAQLGEQYYLRFTDAARLPGHVVVVVRMPLRTLRGVAGLPVANPVAPPPLPLPPPPPLTRLPSWDRPLGWLAALLIVLGIGYGMGMLAASQRNPRPGARGLARTALPSAGPGGDVALEAPGRPHRADLELVRGRPRRACARDLYFVFLIPCLNEEKVILNSLSRLLAMPGGNFVILVIDDGSDDNTVDVVSTVVGDRVWLLSRRLPDARQGKGEALNSAVRYLTDGDQLAGRDADDVIVVVVDADGHLDPHAVAEVSPFFADPSIGAVQIGVRINNRDSSNLARMQDMEFVIYTEVFQRGRRFLGSVGLGGNGQFMRLSALQSLGPAPWTRSLTDDLDLGVRLLTAGWRNEYCSAAAVHQQGIVQLRRLIRQRSRWFQGHLQSWKLVPTVLRHAPRRSRADVLYHLSSPAVLLIASLLTTSFVLSLANSLLLVAERRDPLGWWLATSYGLTFGPALCYSCVYWAKERANGVGLLRVTGLAHLYVCYGMMWYASGWWAVGRTLRGQTGWAKTERVAEAPVAAALPVTAKPLAAAAAAPPALASLAAERPLPSIPLEEEPVTEPIGSLAGLLGGELAAGPTAGPPPGPAHPAGSAPRGRPIRRRSRRAAAALAAALSLAAFGAVTIAPADGHPGEHQWREVFNGYGTISMTGYGPQQVITLQPQQARTPAATHSALVISARRYQDFVATLLVRTVRQLRRGAAGKPKPWEVGWVVWHYTSNQHFYALTLEPTGWILSEQNRAYPGDERFLASGQTPVFRVGSTHRIGIVQIGSLITISADGHLLTQFRDIKQPLLTGAFGLYCEDSDARYSAIKVDELPITPTRTESDATSSVLPGHGQARASLPAKNYGYLRH
jgi:1,2-diacylglycerol 3-beta-glucosyltransferase